LPLLAHARRHAEREEGYGDPLENRRQSGADQGSTGISELYDQLRKTSTFSHSLSIV
jgi:hypothetical protein